MPELGFEFDSMDVLGAVEKQLLSLVLVRVLHASDELIFAVAPGVEACEELMLVMVLYMDHPMVLLASHKNSTTRNQLSMLRLSLFFWLLL